VAEISILMNCYNGETYLKESIDSVISQTFQEWEIIFWDNQSTDDSAKIVSSYDDKRIRYHYAPLHTSLYEGRSRALKHCKGKYLAFLDCDDLWIADKLEKQLNILESNKNIVLVHSNTVFFDSDLNKEKIINKRKRLSGHIFKQNILNYQFSLETVMVRMETVIQNNLDFEKSFNMIGDRDFLSMVCFYGDVHYIHEPLGRWRIHANNFSKELQYGYPRELKKMYLRFKNRFKADFTREMRIEIYNEIVFREALVLFSQSGKEVRRKLRKIHFLNIRGLIFRVLSYMPKKIALIILNSFRRA